MSESLLPCPTCSSHSVVKNGSTRHGKQNHLCKDCDRQFLENPQWRMIFEETRSLINQLLQELIPLAGIARAQEISERKYKL